MKSDTLNKKIEDIEIKIGKKIDDVERLKIEQSNELIEAINRNTRLNL